MTSVPNDGQEAIHFGHDFEVDGSNRLDVLAGSENLPDYIRFSREDLRDSLKLSEGENWPEVPGDISKVEDLFARARGAINVRWREKALPLLRGKCEQWLLKIPEDGENKGIRDLLSEPEKLEEKMEMRQFGILEPLRKVLPEAWGSLIMASSERQMAEVVLLRHWVKGVSEEAAQAMGMSKSELELFADIPAFLGKYIDHGYAKQLEQADRLGGSVQSPSAAVVGGDRVYDVHRKGSETVEELPYVAAFPFELGRFSKMVLHLKGKTEVYLSQGKLPNSYRNMPAYLEKMAVLYSSTETAPEKLVELWNKELASEANRLSKEGCPIVLIPQSTAAVAGDAGKVDVELRLGLRTPQIEEMEGFANEVRGIAQGIADKYPLAVEKPAKIPVVTLTYQPFAFGPNLYWMTRGESAGDKVLSHVNAVADVALRQEIPLLKKAFELDGIDSEAYSRSASVETFMHEISHSVLSNDDPGVKRRLGSGSGAALVEELKADTVNMVLLSRAIAENGEKVDVQAQFMAKLGTICDYVANKSDNPEDSGGRYFFTGIKIAHELLKAGAIEKGESGKYVIRDARKGIEAMGSVGNAILAKYADLKTDPEAIRVFADQIIAVRENPMVKDFISVVRGK